MDFNASITKAVAKTMEHLTDFIFVSMANFLFFFIFNFFVYLPFTMSGRGSRQLGSSFGKLDSGQERLLAYTLKDWD